MKIPVNVLWLLLILSTPSLAVSSETIGHIQTLQGAASIQRGDLIIPATIGAALYRDDTVRTGKPGAVGIVLTDDTSIALGSNSEISLKEYEFNPKEGKFSFLLRMTRGTCVYLSGLIAKLSPQSVRLAIPDAIIATRGTRLLIAVQE